MYGKRRIWNVESYLDNDEAGDKATSKLTSIGAIDKRGAY